MNTDANKLDVLFWILKASLKRSKFALKATSAALNTLIPLGFLPGYVFLCNWGEYWVFVTVEDAKLKLANIQLSYI